MGEVGKKTLRRITAAVAAAALAAAVTLLLLHLLPAPAEVFRTEFPSMGTVAQVSVYSGEEDLTRAFALCKAEFDAVEKLCSLYDPESELSRLNAGAGSAPFVCSDEMWRLILRARQAYAESGGRFDITVKPLMDLWGFYRKRGGTSPSDAEIAETMKRVGFGKLQLDDRRHTVLFTVPGMALDMGGIAKGYAADRAAAKIAAAGIRAGVVDIGGNLRMLPDPPPGRDCYTVAVRDPHRRGKLLPAPLKIAPGRAVSTSGDYERFVILDGGKKFGHIISPQTGRPAAQAAVTVTADSAMDADIFSTACCLGGEQVSDALKAAHPELEIFFAR